MLVIESDDVVDVILTVSGLTDCVSSLFLIEANNGRNDVDSISGLTVCVTDTGLTVCVTESGLLLVIESDDVVDVILTVSGLTDCVSSLFLIEANNGRNDVDSISCF